jgi:N,N'-diacetyllegionaminate synthase
VVTAPRCFVIAEAGVNHNGSADRALELAEVAARAGADAVKFQTFRAEELVAPGAPRAAYQARNLGDGDQYSMLRSLELPERAYDELYRRCAALGIEFMSTPFDAASAAMLVALGMKRIKIGSGEITNLPMLRGLAALARPLILSTGMSTLDEVGEAVAAIREQWETNGTAAGGDMLTLLHCTSNYPAEPQDVNLRAMRTMRERFDVPVGYSDHTAGTAVAVAAVALGASAIEKHFTLDRGLPGPDHKASLEPQQLAQMVSEIRAIECALGNGVKAPAPSELPVRELVRRSVTLVRAVKAGDVIGMSDVALRRPASGIAPRDLERVIGRRAARPLSADAVLHWDDLLP